MVIRLKTCVLLLIALFAFGSYSAEARQYKRKKSSPTLSETVLQPEVQKLIDYGKELLGRRYRSHAGGFTLDCSGFVNYAFSKLDIKLLVVVVQYRVLRSRLQRVMSVLVTYFSLRGAMPVVAEWDTWLSC